jgi:hypothetical protein
MSEQMVQWVAPAPAWNEAVRLNGMALTAFRQPAILRFASDSFMDELLAVLAVDPAALGARRAVWESGATRRPIRRFQSDHRHCSAAASRGPETAPWRPSPHLPRTDPLGSSSCTSRRMGATTLSPRVWSVGCPVCPIG